MFGPSARDEPFPVQAAEDLRGLLRLLYVTTPSSDVQRRRRLAWMGSEMSIAIELAGRPAGVGVTAAWNRAERVCHELGDVIGETTASELVGAAVKRMGRRAG
jgi:hypothetical protein